MSKLAVEQFVAEDWNDLPEREKDYTFALTEFVPLDMAKEVLLTQIAAGNGPDVIGPIDWVNANALPGEWMDLTPLVKDINYDADQFDPALLDMLNNSDGLAGLPFALYPAALEWNAALFQKAGLQPPPAKMGEHYTLPDGSQVDWDWDTLAQVARLLTLDADGKNATQPGFDASRIAQYGFSWGPESHPALTASFWQVASLLAPGGSPGRYRVVIPAAWRASWQWTYTGSYGSQPFLSSDPDAFENGAAAMTIQTVRHLTSFGKVKSFQFAALPAYQVQVTHRLEMETIRIWRGSRQAKSAFAFLAYLSSVGAHKLLVECNGFPPAYDALPARASDQKAFIEFRKRQFPWVSTWDALLANTKNPENSANDGYLPNFDEAWSRIDAFGAKLEIIPDLDLDAEIAALERDLTDIFNKHP